VYWIVNLIDHQVEVYSEPGPQGYRSRHTFRRGRHVPVAIDGLERGRIAVADILPRK
jgi:Uma2 family endonuclease